MALAVYPCSVFLDLCKAFDTVDHKILSANLEYYGMQGVANEGFGSCLSNRRQFVSLFHRNCDCQTVAYVEYHRDQCLGYFSFFNKQNDLPKCSKINILKFHLFADDTNLFPNNTNYFKSRNQLKWRTTKCESVVLR